MKEFKATNTGKSVIINVASTREAKELKRVILKEIQKNPLGLKLLGQTENVFDKQIDFTELIDFIKNVLIGIDTSQEVEDAIFNCLKHCVYDKTHKITESLFDDVPEAREDYYEIIYVCVEENLKSFIKSLVSTWKTHIVKLGKSQVLDTMLSQLT